MKYKLRLSIALVVFVIALAGIFGFIYPLKIFDIQFLPVFQRVFTDFSIAALIILILLLVLTLLTGRTYCSMICPFGILQEVLGLIKGKVKKGKPVKPLNFPLKYFIAAIVLGVLIGGSAVLIRYIEPYTLFGSAMSVSVIGIAAIIIIIAAVIIKDRIFCTNFCPVGTVLGLISKISLNKIYMTDDCVSCSMCARSCPAGCIDFKEKRVDNEICIKCLKCTSVCPKGAIKYGIKPKSKIKFNLKRRQIIIAGAALALFGGMVKAGIEIKDKIAAKLKDVILPPGAVNKERFFNKCLNCNLCVENCPNKIIKKADDEFGVVHIDYSNGFCNFDCKKCGDVCPSGAIKRVSLDEKQKIRIGMAMIDENKCSKCGVCAEACPVGAIIKIDGKAPVLNASKCIGCGACKHACPIGAIEVFEVREQKVI